MKLKLHLLLLAFFSLNFAIAQTTPSTHFDFDVAGDHIGLANESNFDFTKILQETEQQVILVK